MYTRVVSVKNALLVVTVGLILVINSRAQQADLPAPVLTVTKIETEASGDKKFTKYSLRIVNRAAFPDILFEIAPDLPPCGLNNNASRTWVNIYAENGRHLYGFCSFRSASDLDKLWVAIPAEQMPPNNIYVVLTDRRLKKSYKSNLVALDNSPADRGRQSEQAQSSSAKWEYKILRIEYDGVTAPDKFQTKVEGTLNTLGAEGWELIQFQSYNQAATPYNGNYFFKRAR